MSIAISAKPNFDVLNSNALGNSNQHEPFKKIVEKYVKIPTDLDLIIRNLSTEQLNDFLYELLKVDIDGVAPEISKITNVLIEELKTRILGNFTFLNCLQELVRDKNFSSILKGQLIEIEGVEFSSLFLVHYFKGTCKNSIEDRGNETRDLLECVQLELKKFRGNRLLLNMIRLRVQDDLAPLADIFPNAILEFWKDTDNALDCLAFFVKHRFYDFYERFYKDKPIETFDALIKILNPFSDNWLRSLRRFCPEVKFFGTTKILFTQKTPEVIKICELLKNFENNFTNIHLQTQLAPKS